MTLPISTVLNNRYRIVQSIAEGGFGAVYRAWDINLNRRCALKENRQLTPDGRRQFLAEATILSGLNHPNLPRVTDYFEVQDIPYLVMDYIEGESLEALVEQQGALDVEKTIVWFQQICNALTYLHAQPNPVLHRDIKPANIIIRPPSNTYPNGSAVLVDFGISKVYATGRVTSTGARALTPGYAPLEQHAQQGTDTRSDIYSLGATLYTALTGQEPVGSVEREMGKVITNPRAYNPNIHPTIEAAILKAMEIHPQNRYQTVAQFCQALNNPKASLPVSIPTTLKSFQPLGSPVLWVGLTALIILFACMITSWLAKDKILSLFRAPTPIAWETNTPRPTKTVTPTPINEPGSISPTSVLPSETSVLLASDTKIAAVDPTDTPHSSPTPSYTPSPTATQAQVVSVASDPLLNLIAFVSNRSGNNEIYTMKTDGTRIRQITNSPYDDNVPAWSPDGERITYHSNKDGDYDLYIMNQDGSGDRRITSNNCADWSPYWSPDGKKLAFYSDCDGNREIYTINVDGSQRQRLTRDAAVDWFPAWSPDGKKITFTSYRGGRYQVFVMNADGSQQTMLANGCISLFSPNGKRIIFSQYCGSDDYGAISIMKDDGSNTRVLDDNANRNASFSPDGNWIVFQSERTGNSEIWIMDADGKNQTQITDDRAKDAAPVWQP